jgi:hypothetical protein
MTTASFRAPAFHHRLGFQLSTDLAGSRLSTVDSS